MSSCARWKLKATKLSHPSCARPFASSRKCCLPSTWQPLSRIPGLPHHLATFELETLAVLNGSRCSPLSHTPTLSHWVGFWAWPQKNQVQINVRHEGHQMSWMHPPQVTYRALLGWTEMEAILGRGLNKVPSTPICVKHI